MLGGYQRLSNSTIIGESANLGNDGYYKYKDESGAWVTGVSERTIPIPTKPFNRVVGVEISAEGPTHLENIQFLGFRHNDLRKVRGNWSWSKIYF